MNDETQQPQQELTPEEEQAQMWAAFESLIAKEIRQRGEKGQYLSMAELCEVSEQEKDVLLQALEEMKEQEAYKDICVYSGAKDLYYYTYPLLAHNYVKNCVMAQEDDLARIVAEVVRYESEIYPRATKIDTFSRFPYHYTKIQVQLMYEKMKKLPEYGDIETFVSGRGNVYFVSTKYMTLRRAVAITEDAEHPIP